MKSIVTLIATLVTVSAFAVDAQPAKTFPEPKATTAPAAPHKADAKEPMLLAKKHEDKKPTKSTPAKAEDKKAEATKK